MFNTDSRKKNIMRNSLTSATTGVINIGIQFLYRSFFLLLLTKEYLGIEGLFSNVIQLLSLAELGFGTVIAYRLYNPMEKHKITEVASIMNFYRKVYIIVACVITFVGVSLLPVIHLFIKDSSEIPHDVNLHSVFLLFLAQSVSSYFFTYKQAILVADQHNEIVAIFNTISAAIKTALQLIVLLLTHNYQIQLFTAIIINMMLNWLFSLYINNRYRNIFEYHTQISKDLKRKIYHDLRATLMHKIGGVISTSTDNLILSAYIGLGTLGIYSNYTLIIEAVKKIIILLLGNHTASIGNARLQMDDSSYYTFYEKLLLINFMITNITSVCLFVLINPFICLWQNKSMVFNVLEVGIIVACYYINTIRLTNISFTNADGLYIKDIFRPLIENAINLIISVYLANKIGFKGVFIGTIVSNLTTVGWREPLILYRFSFHRNVFRYWTLYIKNTLLTLISCILLNYLLYNRISSYPLLLICSILVAMVTFLLTAFTFYNQITKPFIKKFVMLLHQHHL
ncbi:lipopolysaccharide biosynthesis protein [Butyrivibrio fibrisolvens]|uniref:lipopolysaccharide biosynthesis protein n=1 Tax=Butyrivibrio fibrisolvens TaxID=831 RepID=UPI000425F46B|nr:hypothetical protein [Butyrivibrio fibrisolvens]